MTLVLHQNAAGETLRTETLDRRRRRLSSLLRHRMPKRPAIVAVRRANHPPQSLDDTVRLRREWASTLVAGHDIVVITYLPLGGGGSRQGQGGGKAIGAAVAALALAIVAPYAAGFLASSVMGLTGVAATVAKSVIALAIVAGGSYLLSRATKAKANKNDDGDRPVYGVSGGGNAPRIGDRIPINYGRVWVQPDLSQPDYSIYDGDDMVLYKRLTLGGGKYRIHRIRIGQATMWVEGEGLKQPFNSSELEFIVPGQGSALVPSSVYSSENVAGSEMPRPDDTINWMGPFAVCPVGATTAMIQLDYTCAQCYQTNPNEPQPVPGPWGVTFQYAPIDDDNNLTGGWSTLHASFRSERFTRAKRVTQFVSVPDGRYAVRAQNAVNNLSPAVENDGFSQVNAMTWDGLRGHLHHDPVRPNVTEIAMKIRSGKALGSTTSFSDIWVEATSVLPVWTGSGWTEQAERRAVWVAADILRNQVYGGAIPDDQIDLARLKHYSDTLGSEDTFDGTIRGPVSVVEAACTALGVIRAEAIRTGSVWTIVRDEPRQVRKHLITRRQIIASTTGVDYDFDVTDGSSDVIVEYYVDGDPRKKNEYRETVGQQTITPRRINAFGVSSHGHAVRLARWYAAAAYYRRESRAFTVEMTGRIFARNDPASIEAWFLNETQAAGVATRSGRNVVLDVDLALPAGAHAVFRTTNGREWGPVAVTAGAEPRQIVLDEADAQVIENTTSESFASLFNQPKRRGPVSVLIGTLSEVLRPYIIRSVKGDDKGRHQVTAVYDAPEVWVALGESVPLPPPIGEVIEHEGEMTPVLSWIRGTVVQKSVAVILDWAVAQARGCEHYRVDISYDGGVHWECVSEGAMLEGSYPVPYWDDTAIRLRGIAYNGQGIPSAAVYATADMLKPTIDDSVANLVIKYENMVEEFRKEIDQIRDRTEGSLHGAIDDLYAQLDQLAADSALEGVTAYDRAETLAVKMEGRLAAIGSRIKLLVDDDQALAQRIDTMLAQMDENQAAIVNQLTVLAGVDTALAEQIFTVSTTVGEHSASLSQVSESVDGMSVQFSVIGNIDGATGGFVLSGVKQLDGSVQYEMKIKGDLLVDGSVMAQSLFVPELSAITASLGNIHAGNIYLNSGKLRILDAGRIEVDD